MQNATTDLPTGSAARVLARNGSTRTAIGVEDVLADADANRGRASFVDYVRFAVVAGYLSVVFVWLVLTRQIALNVPFRPILRRMLWLHVRHPVAMSALEHRAGHCFKARVHHRIPSDTSSGQVSRVCVYEDGMPLAMAHVPHEAIATLGLGRFSHWDGFIYFSTSDNTDPRANGRKYTFKEV